MFACYGVIDGVCECGDVECTDAGKHPRTANGFYDATIGDDDIGRWWGKWPQANIGVRTGAESDLLVLDEDPRNGGDKELARLEAQYGPLPRTVTARTGGGGRHHYFKYPVGNNVYKNSIAPGLDTKADGGYVIGVGSTHISGATYQYAPGCDPDSIALADVPQWLLQLATKTERTSSAQNNLGRRIPQGQRNTTLYRLGCGMRGGDFEESEIRAALVETNRQRCDPPLADAEVEKIARQAAQYDPNNPQDAPLPAFEIIDDDEFESLPTPDMLIDGVLPQGALAVLAGESDTYKSFLGVDLGFHVATGKAWRGRDVQRGPVLYVVAEGRGFFPLRVRAWRQNYGVQGKTGFKVLPRAVQLVVEQERAALLSAIDCLTEKPVLIVIDTLARCFVGFDENGSHDMGLFVAALDRIRAVTGSAILVIHHTGWEGKHERGSNSLRGAVDTVMKLERDATDVIELRNIKQKDLDLFEPLAFRKKIIELEVGVTSCVLLGTMTKQNVSQPVTPEMEAMMGVLRMAPNGISLSEWYRAYGGPEKIAESTFRLKVKRLSRRYVQKEGQGKGSRYYIIGETGNGNIEEAA